MTGKVIIQVPVELDDEFFEDIICAMIEGGSGYWVHHVQIAHSEGEKPKGVPTSTWVASAINKGGKVSFFPREEKDIYILTKENLIAGVQAWVTDNGTGIVDAGDIDADDADCILQFALFGKVVYG